MSGRPGGRTNSSPRQGFPVHRIASDTSEDRLMSNLGLQLRDYRLTTAEILYHIPDYPSLLQSYVWQELDLAPRFPILRRFLDFWTTSLDGKLHSVKVASAGLITPGKFRNVAVSLTLH
jgi:uncharacterized protein Usg